MAKKKKDTNKELAAAQTDRQWTVVHTNTTLTLDCDADQRATGTLETEDVSAIINAALRSGMLRIHIEQFDDLVSNASHSETHYATEVELDGGGACAMASDGSDSDSEVYLVLCGDRGFCLPR